MDYREAQLLKLKEEDEAYLTMLRGPKPVNPFKELRKQHCLSLGEVAYQTKLSKNAVVRAEAGDYARPLNGLIAYWVKRGASLDGIEALGYLDLEAAYFDYQDLMRKRHAVYFGPFLTRSSTESKHHPFTFLRKTRPAYSDSLQVLPVGLNQVSSDLCIPLTTLRFWETKWKTQQSMPKVVKQVLCLSYSRSQVDFFESVYKQWRENQING